MLVLLDGPSVSPRSFRHSFRRRAHFLDGIAANWITFLPVIRSRATNDSSNNTLYLLTQGLFGIFLSLMVLLIEKLLIQIMWAYFRRRPPGQGCD